MSNRLGTKKLAAQLEKKLPAVVLKNLHRIGPDYPPTTRCQRLIWAARNPEMVKVELVKLRLRGEL